MESTLKIDFQSRGKHFTPIIKIVQPVSMSGQPSDEVFEDPKDKLISNLLHTPCMIKGNFLFEVHSRETHPTEDPKFVITTISPIEEDNMVRTIRRHILEKLFSDEENRECYEFLNSENYGTLNQELPTPIGFDKYLKTQNFFEWLSKQDCWNNTVKQNQELNSKLGSKPVKKSDARSDFKEAALPLMKYLSENHYPHVYATVDSESAMLIEGLQTVQKNEDEAPLL